MRTYTYINMFNGDALRVLVKSNVPKFSIKYRQFWIRVPALVYDWRTKGFTDSVIIKITLILMTISLVLNLIRLFK